MMKNKRDTTKKTTMIQVLSAIGGGFIGVNILVLIGSASQYPPYLYSEERALSYLLAVVSFALVITILIGASMMDSTRESRIRVGSVVVLISGIVNLVVILALLGGAPVWPWLGFIFCSIGGILGLIRKASPLQ